MEGLKSAATAIDRLRNFKLRLESAKFEDGLNPKFVAAAAQAMKAFRESLDDDLNTAEALAAIFEFVREANIAMDRGEFLSLNREGALAVLNDFDCFFDVLKPTPSTGGLSDVGIDQLDHRAHGREESARFRPLRCNPRAVA